jgi:ferritin-like metal-binding protein YciE
MKEHLEQTKQQVSRLEKVFQTVNMNPRSKPCAGMRA